MTRHLPEDAREREDLGLVVVRLLEGDFGRHVAERACHARHRAALVGLLVAAVGATVPEAAHAKVEEHHAPVCPEADVVGLEVAVEDAVASREVVVAVVERLRDSQRHMDGPRQRPALDRLLPLPERHVFCGLGQVGAEHAGEQLHAEEGDAVVAPSNGDDADHVGVVHPGHQVHLALQVDHRRHLPPLALLERLHRHRLPAEGRLMRIAKFAAAEVFLLAELRVRYLGALERRR
mmetsp:Transcript_1216/g.2493  ORF Transcript_1216/g.2493 Transcript_1216/m.2493 type:complete len:235 (+) Transcript_1216:1841-2545(+)